MERYESLDSYVKIRVIYCSEYYDEVLGYSEDGVAVVAIILPEATKAVYPMQYDIVYVKQNYVYPTGKVGLNYHVLPFVRYGSLALYIKNILLNKPFKLCCNKAIKKIFEFMIGYKDPNIDTRCSTPCSPCSLIISVTDDFPPKITINDDIIEYCIVHNDYILQAIQNVGITNCIVTELLNLQMCKETRRSHSGAFFKIFKLGM